MQRQRGLTLLELLVVLTIIGFAMAGVSLSLRDSSQTQLEREAQRLVAHLEAARAQSRTSGIAQVWRIAPQGYEITSMPTQAGTPSRQEAWLSASTQAHIQPRIQAGDSAPSADVVVLGPEAIISPISITLSVSSGPANAAHAKPSLRLTTNGLTPFEVAP
jgi:general secretion pathway protein H